MPRPVTTADGAIGMERNRSTTPLALSVLTATAVPTNPKAIVMANMPGIRKVR